MSSALLDEVFRLCHVLKLPVTSFELACFITHRLSNHLNTEIAKNSQDKRQSIVKSLSAAIIWVALQADELVSFEKYDQRDVIHAVWDFTKPDAKKAPSGRKSVVVKKEEAVESNEKPSATSVTTTVTKQEFYDELAYNRRLFHLEAQQMHILRLLDFNCFPPDSVLPSSILTHWSRCLFDHRLRPDDPRLHKFNTVLFSLYTDSLKIESLWRYKRDEVVKSEFIPADKKGGVSGAAALDIPDYTGPASAACRKVCMTLLYLSIKVCQEEFPNLKFANIAFMAPEVKMPEIERISQVLNLYF